MRKRKGELASVGIPKEAEILEMRGMVNPVDTSTKSVKIYLIIIGHVGINGQAQLLALTSQDMHL